MPQTPLSTKTNPVSPYLFKHAPHVPSPPLQVWFKGGQVAASWTAGFQLAYLQATKDGDDPCCSCGIPAAPWPPRMANGTNI
jgi:hypothetical protein